VKEFAIYTAARLVLFVVAYAAVVGVYLLVSGSDRVPLIWPFVLAVLVSAVASALLLRRQRDAFALAVQRRAERASTRFEEMRGKEDDPER
jgi:predicted neutral ceramidase superfamily lipid hydrolase